MKRQFELPVRKVVKASKSIWVYSKDDFLICKSFGHQRADYIVQAINSHEKLLDYAQHKPDCNLLSPIPCVKYNGKEVGCDCGFEQTLKEAGEQK